MKAKSLHDFIFKCLFTISIVILIYACQFKNSKKFYLSNIINSLGNLVSI
ncbi:putative lipoprotein [[Clostridium] bifermentans ATCC 19299]|nr:putative lipoprotein [[Clostridium] bifermentans ATCC 19299] [Paraclostridium bifermentans ATCC 19299]